MTDVATLEQTRKTLEAAKTAAELQDGIRRSGLCGGLRPWSASSGIRRRSASGTATSAAAMSAATLRVADEPACREPLHAHAKVNAYRHIA